LPHRSVSSAMSLPKSAGARHGARTELNGAFWRSPRFCVTTHSPLSFLTRLRALTLWGVLLGFRISDLAGRVPQRRLHSPQLQRLAALSSQPETLIHAHAPSSLPSHRDSISARCARSQFIRRPELEARARAIGLLGECQSITHIRVFKRAKKSLGIRSRRAGFGARSQWLWELSPQNEASIKAERGAAPHNRFPVEWVEGVALSRP
jgi:hypothetical protein